MSSTSLSNLIASENKANELFELAQSEGLIYAGQSEKELNDKIYALAFNRFGITKYWHKRIVRAGTNTLFPYKENPPNLVIQKNDIIFFDFGPIFDEWEADFGRTFVLGADPRKIKMQHDVEEAWYWGRSYVLNNSKLTAAGLYQYTTQLAASYGWEYGGPHCGHLIGKFPHEIIQGDEIINYLHPENDTEIVRVGANCETLCWIYEIHFISRSLQIGGFYEQLLV